MRILFIADGRSPIAINWIRYFAEMGHEIHLFSLYPCRTNLRLKSSTVFSTPLTPSGETRKIETNSNEGKFASIHGVLTTPRLRTFLRHWLLPFTFPRASQALHRLILQIQPDLIHSMRIPYEGIISALALKDEKHPLLVSVWGNDFSLHANSTPLMNYYTRLTLTRTDALHTDCYRDLKLAQLLGYEVNKPSIILPGAGGIQPDIFYAQGTPSVPVVINARGFRSYVRNDTFFRAIPLVLKQKENTRFICPAMAGEPQALSWLSRLNIAHAVNLLPVQTRIQMGNCFRQARIALSITEHDGTPNTLLEAMACGCFPIAGDLESVREWITPGINGLLIDPSDSQALSDAKDINSNLIAERASYPKVMKLAFEFYNNIHTDLPEIIK
jgi:glycosyltransferase involved in cell wall biosynthesis